VYFAAAVFDFRRPADVQVRLFRLVAPFVRVLCFNEFCDEFIESCVTVTGTSAGYSSESDGIAIVVHAEFFVALNGGAGCETQ
jgi:hypothetical protein